MLYFRFRVADKTWQKQDVWSWGGFGHCRCVSSDQFELFGLPIGRCGQLVICNCLTEMKCHRTGIVIFLEQGHLSGSHYSNSPSVLSVFHFQFWSMGD